MSQKTMMCPPFNASLISYTRPLLEIERDFDTCRAFTWLGHNWTVSNYFLVVYLVAIFAGQQIMRNRPPFRLRTVLLLWNVTLAVFSIVLTWRLASAVLYTLWVRGFSSAFCSMGQWEEVQAVGLWLFLAPFSKVVELGDTVFIVLRKSPLTFLHWYHHLSVVIYTWFTCPFPSPMHTYFITINLFIHSIMYSYYALKVLGVGVPKAISMAITSMQVLQMAAGLLLTWYGHWRKTEDSGCGADGQRLAFSASLYLTYLVLFLNFFNKSYVVGRQKPASCRGNQKKVS